MRSRGALPSRPPASVHPFALAEQDLRILGEEGGENSGRDPRTRPEHLSPKWRTRFYLWILFSPAWILKDSMLAGLYQDPSFLEHASLRDPILATPFPSLSLSHTSTTRGRGREVQY